MLFNNNLYYNRPPLQSTALKSRHLRSDTKQATSNSNKKKCQDTDVSYKYLDAYENRSGGKNVLKNVYENENSDINRRPKPYCPLSKTKVVLDEQVMKKSREYVRSNEYKNFVDTVTTSSKNKQDLLERMKKVRSNNIYLPISQQEIHKSSHKSQQKRHIFGKVTIEQDNQELGSDLDLSIDHLSKIEEKQTINLDQRNVEANQPKYTHHYTQSFDPKRQNPAILIEDQPEHGQTNKHLDDYQRKKTPECVRSPIFQPSNKKPQKVVQRQQDVTLTKRKYPQMLTPPKSIQRNDSLNKFFNYKQVQYFKKSEKYQNEQTNNKYPYLKMSCANQMQRQNSDYKIHNKSKPDKPTQSLHPGFRYDSLAQSIQSGSIYNVDFKLQRPMPYAQSQKTFKKVTNPKCQCQDRISKFQNNRKADLNLKNFGLTDSKSRSKGKLSVVTMSKSTNFH